MTLEPGDPATDDLPGSAGERERRFHEPASLRPGYGSSSSIRTGPGARSSRSPRTMSRRMTGSDAGMCAGSSGARAATDDRRARRGRRGRARPDLTRGTSDFSRRTRPPRRTGPAAPSGAPRAHPLVDPVVAVEVPLLRRLAERREAVGRDVEAGEVLGVGRERRHDRQRDAVWVVGADRRGHRLVQLALGRRVDGHGADDVLDLENGIRSPMRAISSSRASPSVVPGSVRQSISTTASPGITLYFTPAWTIVGRNVSRSSASSMRA